MTAGENTGARGRTHGGGGVEAVEANGLCGELIEVRRLQFLGVRCRPYRPSPDRPP